MKTLIIAALLATALAPVAALADDIFGGTWAADKSSAYKGLTVTYVINGLNSDMLAMSNSTGQSYDAKTDGTDSPFIGDSRQTSVSVKMTGKHTLVETDKRNGKVIGVMHATVSADGKTMLVSYRDKLRGTTLYYTATKQL